MFLEVDRRNFFPPEVMLLVSHIMILQVTAEVMGEMIRVDPRTLLFPSKKPSVQR